VTHPWIPADKQTECKQTNTQSNSGTSIEKTAAPGADTKSLTSRHSNVDGNISKC
jgi:hypothetical protein